MVANISQFETGEENQAPVVEETKKIAAAPAAERLAAEMDVDLATVTGTGKDGRIIKKDVEKAIKARREANTTQANPVPDPSAQVEPEPAPDPTAWTGPRGASDVKSFGFKLVGNFNGHRYELVGLHTDAFGSVELIFDEVQA